jgi:type IV pilus assembly protein PilV
MHPTSQQGFSLIEVLVSVLVLGIGIIGAAGMQLNAMRTAQQSAFQTAALTLAGDIADKMRANDQLMKQADQANPFIGIDYSTKTEPSAPRTSCYGANANCSAQQIASFDIYEWMRRMKDVLPEARAVVCRDATPWDSAANAYRWDCSGAGADVPLVVKIGWQAKNPDGSMISNEAEQFPPLLAMTIAPYIK